MKHLFFGILSSLLLLSCETIDDLDHSLIFEFQNNSGHSISMLKWRQGNAIIADIANTYSHTEEVAMFGGAALISESDSLHIIFDGKKILRFKHNDNRVINILHLENYTVTADGYTKYYDYTFTNTDYESAVDCNGDCE